MYFKIKKILNDREKFIVYDRFFVSNWNFIVLHVKTVKNSRFFQDF